ncbi:MAG: transcription antitermination factor NusB [Bacteroidales bacterium]|nr:transcription antitermination factor NusB [Bacteroidales bacterium]MDD3161245.1 transcription antitermination factor NusB [Bacteroidales bacterium]
MINRILIRIKTIQILYSFYQGGNSNPSTAQKELLFSLEKSYELYNALLYLIVQLTTLARRRIEYGKVKLMPTVDELAPNTRFVDNKFADLMARNKALLSYVDEKSFTWDDNFLKNMLGKIIASDIYKEYMESEDFSFKNDQEFWRKIYKNIIFADDDLIALLEEKSIYWNDDLEIVSTFVMKTIKRMDMEQGGEQELLPMFRDEEDKDYACKLLRDVIKNEKEYREMINVSIKNWDIERIAFMDIVIMEVAIAELINFPTIPVNVTFNEFLEIAKDYSTEKSSTFINGVLDNIVAKLKTENRLLKN